MFSKLNFVFILRPTIPVTISLLDVIMIIGQSLLELTPENLLSNPKDL